MPRVNEFLSKLRAAGITQANFAKYLGRHRRTVGRWANDEVRVPRYVMYEVDTLLSRGPRGVKQMMNRRASIHGEKMRWGQK